MIQESLRAARRRRTRTFAAISTACVLAAAAVACGIDAVATKDYPVVEAGVDAPAEVSLPPKPDAPVGVPDAAEAGVDASPTCPTGHGAMVVVDAGGLFFCIDATEVTNSEYAKFVTATGGGNVDSGAVDAGTPDGCAGNTSYAPSTVLGGPGFPVVNIDWCDGHAYCVWAGKRLCGKQVNLDASTGEWYAACSKGGTQPYPYGPTYKANTCNDKNTGVKAVGSSPACVGSVPGLFDMNSNVSELVDNCSGGNCTSMGGDYAGQGACAAASDYPQLGVAGSIGLRCCADLR